MLALGKIRALQPEPLEGQCELQALIAEPIGRQTPLQRHSNIVVLQLEPLEPAKLIGSGQFRFGPSSQFKEALEMPRAHDVRLTGLSQPFSRVLTHRLEVAIPAASIDFFVSHDERLVDQA